jgi:hypothetical protein
MGRAAEDGLRGANGCMHAGGGADTRAALGQRGPAGDFHAASKLSGGERRGRLCRHNLRNSVGVCVGKSPAGASHPRPHCPSVAACSGEGRHTPQLSGHHAEGLAGPPRPHTRLPACMPASQATVPWGARKRVEQREPSEGPRAGLGGQTGGWGGRRTVKSGKDGQTANGYVGIRSILPSDARGVQVGEWGTPWRTGPVVSEFSPWANGLDKHPRNGISPMTRRAREAPGTLPAGRSREAHFLGFAVRARPCAPPKHRI